MEARVIISDASALEDLRTARVPKNTQNATLFAVNLYNKWREYHRGLGNRYAPLDCGVPEILNQAIPKFLYEIRRKDGQQEDDSKEESIAKTNFGTNTRISLPNEVNLKISTVTEHDIIIPTNAAIENTESEKDKNVGTELTFPVNCFVTFTMD